MSCRGDGGLNLGEENGDNIMSRKGRIWGMQTCTKRNVDLKSRIKLQEEKFCFGKSIS